MVDEPSENQPNDHQPAGPLAGIRVLDMGTVNAAPIAAMLLGDYGAEVIRVEHPQGDPARTHGDNQDGHGLWWKVIARNKRTVTLNLGKPEGQQILRRLAGTADVVIENFRPGVMERWGLGPEELLRVNPALVILRVTGFGQFGTYAQRRAFGTLAEAMSGFAHQRPRRRSTNAAPIWVSRRGGRDQRGVCRHAGVVLAGRARACTTSSGSSLDDMETDRETTHPATRT